MMEDNKIYTDRIKQLSDILMHLLVEASNIYPIVKKYKRTTKLTNELNQVWNKTFPAPELIVGKYYIYVPDLNTIKSYSSNYGGRQAKLLRIGKAKSGDMFYDSRNMEECIYLVQVSVPIGGLGSLLLSNSYQFFTRKQCLK